MDKLILLTDGSVNTKSKIGFGAYLATPSSDLPPNALATLIKIKRFENTSSSKLELQTLLWALGEVTNTVKQVTIYTDSQNITELPRRRKRFEENEYRTTNGNHISNYILYQEFYRFCDLMDLTLVKVHGHKLSVQKDLIDNLFTLVDRASRNALRADMNNTMI